MLFTGALMFVGRGGNWGILEGLLEVDDGNAEGGSKSVWLSKITA